MSNLTQEQVNFKNTVKDYITLDKKIAEAEKTIKILKTRKEMLYNNVFRYMVNHEIKELNLPGGEKIKTYTRKSRPGVTKAWVSDRLHSYCSTNHLNYNELYDFIYDPQHRPQVEKQSIKKMKAKKTTKK